MAWEYCLPIRVTPTFTRWRHRLSRHRRDSSDCSNIVVEMFPRDRGWNFAVLKMLIWLVVWLSANALASINVVALRQTWLVPGWVTVCGRVNHFGM